MPMPCVVAARTSLTYSARGFPAARPALGFLPGRGPGFRTAFAAGRRRTPVHPLPKVSFFLHSSSQALTVLLNVLSALPTRLDATNQAVHAQSRAVSVA